MPLYGASRLGTLTHLDDGTASGFDDYRYELNDHLGAARVVFHRPTTSVQVETMELAGVPAKAAFLNDDLYRVAVSGAPSGDYVARLTDSQPVGQESNFMNPVNCSVFAIFIALSPVSTVPHVENAKVILMFDKDSVNIYRMVLDLKFLKRVEPLSAEYFASAKDKIVTYSLLGDTVQYYTGPGERMLLYCKLNKLAKYSKYIKFIFIKKTRLVNGKYKNHNKIVFEDKAGFEEIELSFYLNKINKIRLVCI